MRHTRAAFMLTASLTAWADQPVTFAARDNGFAVSSTATGVVRKDSPFLVVTLTRHVLRAGTDFTTPTKVTEYRVGLASRNAQGQWDIKRWSDALPAGFTMNSGDTRQLPMTTALIPIDNLSSLKNSWLVVQVKVHRDGIDGTTYSHSGPLTPD